MFYGSITETKQSDCTGVINATLNIEGRCIVGIDNNWKLSIKNV